MSSENLSEGFQGLAKGESILTLLESARRFAAFNRAILIRGERGTGKELLARYIHHHSPRRDKPFITINCAAFQKELLSAELYGHERGAFTGADSRRIGRLEQAHGGTLFLDEIGNMPVEFQENILRVIEYQEFERVGGRDKITVDVRFISATNAPLEDMSAEQNFRADLLDRISFASLTMPPLRQRRDEIPALIAFMVQKLQVEIPDLPQKKFQRDSIDQLVDYHWPGNLREFKNVIERLYLGPSGQLISPADLPPEIQGVNEELEVGSFHDRVEGYKRQLILETLVKNDWKQTLSATSLDMSFDSFRHHYRKFKMDDEKKRRRN
ncbi:MAG: sigma-54-dependent Fis family transcriptional regulator [Planctomycetes bacterium]|nr:sigma-54-dependent Fis family transcriptional regulator [Planctomycetota bacterium]